ncbi:F-box/kelch-repeat protein At3g27150 [Castanea sativa]|uniref:F-box/kelch-repeat protein At3g27150 n=1 Tax=Castanea sativa TaxID=21020 RepID=UPI003F6502A8
MSQGKEIEGEEERENLCTDDSKHGSVKGGLLAMDLDSSSCIYSHSPPPRKIRVGPWDGSTSSRVGGSSGGEPQDADYSVVASLSEELEALILARVPRSEYGKFSIVNKMFLTLVKSGEVYKIRKEIGFKEPSVFMLACGETSWRACDRQFGSCRKLPILPSDICFSSGDKESVCAGTHLIVSGKEYDGVVIWRYELASNKWFKGPNMKNPRCLFASATCGTCAFVAGGIGMESNWKALSSAEKYNPETKSWESLPGMHKKRKLCSGCYMDNKFYVIGGTDEEGKGLTCAEAFEEQRNNWDLIPNMLKDSPVQSSQSPPLVAVVNNELYSLEASSNELKVYIKGSNSWKNLGPVPVRADVARGWGVAFKSLGDELLVIGTSTNSVHGMTIYTCSPEPQADKLHWRAIEGCTNQLSPFILNCSVMVA